MGKIADSRLHARLRSAMRELERRKSLQYQTGTTLEPPGNQLGFRSPHTLKGCGVGNHFGNHHEKPLAPESRIASGRTDEEAAHGAA